MFGKGEGVWIFCGCTVDTIVRALGWAKVLPLSIKSEDLGLSTPHIEEIVTHIPFA